MTRYAYERIGAGLPMPGVIEVVAGTPIGRAIEDLVLLITCSEEGEIADQVWYVPL